jgi:hypothetical protein
MELVGINRYGSVGRIPHRLTAMVNKPLTLFKV